MEPNIPTKNQQYSLPIFLATNVMVLAPGKEIFATNVEDTSI